MEDTIAAIATAYGEGGIGIVRVSGEKAKEILDTIFLPVCKHRTGGTQETPFLPEAVGETIGKPVENRRLTYGTIIDPDQKKTVDEVLAVYMKAPYTYTKEDVVEIQCHGSVVSLRNVLALCLEKGARLAEPGEFTKRAFLNGRIDLSQAEAVIDAVRARTDRGFDVALSQMEGKLSGRIREIRGHLMDMLVQTTVNLDYPDEDIEEINYQHLSRDISLVREDISSLLKSAETGKMLREGISVTLAGRPNVGKSSLMNLLLRESRAIVTDIPGTTRDTIEEFLNLDGIPLRLTDTAGIRPTNDTIERIGIERSKEAINKADLTIFIVAGNEPLTAEDKEILSHLQPRKTIILLNKRDLGTVVTGEQMAQMMPQAVITECSMTSGEGIQTLTENIKEMVFGGRVTQSESMVVTNVRHEDLLKKAEQELAEAADMVGRAEALDFVEVNLHQAFDYLGEIIGETVSDQIINEVFSRFCLGK